MFNFKPLIAMSYYDPENDPADNDPGTGESSGEE